MRKKRLFAALLALAIVTALSFALVACNNGKGNGGETGDDTEQGDNSGNLTETNLIPTEGLKYELNKDGNSYSVQGLGIATDTDIVIAKTYGEKNLPVTEIGNGAFRKSDSIISVFIPNSVKRINHSAFYNCSKLKHVNIPDGLTYLGGDVFDYCTSLNLNEYDNALYLGNSNNKYIVLIKAENVDIDSCTIHQNTKFICDEAFKNCSRLTKIDIPNRVTTIGNSAFENCTGITEITLPDVASSIGVKAFKNCSELKSINIPDKSTWFGGSAFSGCGKLIQYENGIMYVDKWIIGCLSYETNITVRSDTIGIAADAHIHSDYNEIITIPDSIKYIYQGGIRDYQQIKYNGTKQQWLNNINTPFNLFATVQCLDGNIKYYNGEIE